MKALPFAKLTKGMNVTRRMNPSGSRVRAVILNAPQVMAQISKLSILVSGPIADRAVTNGGEVIRDKWRDLVQAQFTSDRSEGNYERAIIVRKASVRETEEGTLKGASVYIYPGTVAGVPEVDQPRHYAAVLEFGGQLSAAQHSSVIPATPTARPAFDASYEDAVDEVADTLRAALATVVGP